MPILEALEDSSRPVFLFGVTPPREGTTVEKAKQACAKFAARSAVLAADGFIVYDIQDEGGRTTMERPFPFRKTMDPSLYASFFPPASGKQCVVYKSVSEDTKEGFENWLSTAVGEYGHSALTLVGAPTSKVKYTGPSLAEAGLITRTKCKFGCVCIPERHTLKGNEDQNMFRKSNFGAEWFITQGIFDAIPLIKLLHSYGTLCRKNGVVPKKVIITFAPCGREKTMTFIKWLGMHVPDEIRARILGADSPVKESIDVHCDLLKTILEGTSGTGVPLGINVESLSIFKEEIDGAHELFQKLQAILLNSTGSPWSVRWFFAHRPLQYHIPSISLASVASNNALIESSSVTGTPKGERSSGVAASSNGIVLSAALVIFAFIVGRVTKEVV